ncbi:MAG: endonuclease domain-containing protein [Clostridia bacterium]|nr:endonuclease domain-containing protein [Clostridia bacterium]
MTKLRNEKLKTNSRKLRKEMTEEERKLWYCFLKTCGVHFYRQRVFEKYIVDFYCPSAHLVIELDGSQHYEDEAIKADNNRDEYFYKLGITVLRFSNLQINSHFDEVKNTIYKYIR